MMHTVNTLIFSVCRNLGYVTPTMRKFLETLYKRMIERRARNTALIN